MYFCHFWNGYCLSVCQKFGGNCSLKTNVDISMKFHMHVQLKADLCLSSFDENVSAGRLLFNYLFYFSLYYFLETFFLILRIFILKMCVTIYNFRQNSCSLFERECFYSKVCLICKLAQSQKLKL